MVTKTTVAFLSTSLFVIVLAILVDASEGQASARYNNGYAAPRFFGGWGQQRGFWARARSAMPRLIDVAAEAAAALALPTLAVLAISAIWPQRQYYRSKREVVEGSEAPIDELSEHMMNIYFAAMESDECLQRIVCEVGAASRSLKSDNLTSMISILGASSPSKYSKLFEKFKLGMNAEKCEMLGCSLLDH